MTVPKYKEYYNSSFLIFLFILSIINIGVPIITFSWLDEAIAVTLFFYMFTHGNPFAYKEFRAFSFTMIGYVIYSLLISINVPQAVFFDFLQFLKPFISFYAVYLYSSSLQKKPTKVLQWFCIASGIFFWAAIPFIIKIYGNSAGYAVSCLITSFAYYYISRQNTKAKIMSLLIVMPGLFADKAKFIATFVIIIYVIFFLKKKIKFNIKYITIIFLLTAIAIYLNFEKFSNYFIIGLDNGMARAYFYYYSIVILTTYIPFGSGFGTFGTEATRLYYSPLYYEYGINNVWGCSPFDAGTEYSFIADTFFPVLAEFGICGIVLFIWFWKNRINTINALPMKHYKIGIILIFFIFIHSIADSGIMLGPSSIPTFMLLGFICSNYKHNEKSENFYYRTNIQR